MFSKKTLKTGPAFSFGWMRRAELATPGQDVWEAPDGRLITVDRGRTPSVYRAPGTKAHVVWR